MKIFYMSFSLRSFYGHTVQSCEWKNGSLLNIDPSYSMLLFFFPFRYNFSLFFKEELKKPSKSCNYTYSHQLGKLFTQKNVDVPITFQTSFALPENFQIRSYLAFDADTYRTHPVEKCPADLKEWACEWNFNSFHYPLCYRLFLMLVHYF